MNTSSNLKPSNPKEYLFNHILLGFVGSFKGLIQLRERGMISDSQYNQMMEDNSKRLVSRIEKFKQALSIILAATFISLQVTSHNIDFRRGRILRLRRTETEISYS